MLKYVLNILALLGIMEISISEKIYNANQNLVKSKDKITPDLNNLLNNLLSWPYIASMGTAIDSNNLKTESFGTLIYTCSVESSVTEIAEVQNDNVACIIDSYDELNLENFHEAYYRIANAKKLHKRSYPQTNGVPRKETLGIILATRTTLSLECLADELQFLNQKNPCSEWPEMIAILSQGTINYSIQFPGEKRFYPFLLPSSELLIKSQPAFYVVPVMTTTGEHTLNKVFSFIFTQLNAFLPGTNLPCIDDVMGTTSRMNVTLAGYQFNLTGKLLPVSPEYYAGRYLPQQPQIFKDKKHNISFTLQFMAWQDGAVILLKGKIPLEGLLIYLGEKANNRLAPIKRDILQISSVLPITKEDYLLMLQRIQTQTPFKLEKPEISIVKQKIADEGANSPFVARLLIGIPILREAIFHVQYKRDGFDNIFHTLIMKLWSLKTTAQETLHVFSEHSEKIHQKSIVCLEENAVRISESIDQKLKKNVDGFINEALRIFKQGMQNLTKFFDVNIGFLYQKSDAFYKGLENQKITDPNFAFYLAETRKWSEKLVEIRNKMEHEWWELPNIAYSISGDSVHIDEPIILEQPLTIFIPFMLDRLSCFVEEVTVYCMQKKLPNGISLMEIALKQRKPELPLRFRIITVMNNTIPWSINYNSNIFEQI